MSSNYNGYPFFARSPASAPSPGSSPTVSLPADADPNNVATMFAQQYPVLADYLSYIQRSIRLFPSAAAALNTSSAQAGFSGVTHTGSGGGTVVPTGTSWAGLNVVIKIILGGAVGVATFQYSVDGGTSYSGTQLTAATYTISGSMVANFAGTFVAGDTYSWQQLFTPFARFANDEVNGQFLIDHNGLPGGRISAWDEMWRVHVPSGVSADPWSNYAHQRFVRLAGTTHTYLTAAGYDGLLSLNVAATASLLSDSGFVYASSGISMAPASTALARMLRVFEFEASLSAVGVNGFSVLVGLNAGTASGVATNALWFRRTSGAVQPWEAVSIVGGVTTSATSTIVPSAGVRDNFKIEIHSDTTPLGIALGAAKALFFINNVLVLVSSVPTPAAPGLLPSFGSTCTTGGNSLTIDVSGWNARATRIPNSVL